ncbi:MAG TPA: valine--tRNA ligase, partial [Terriglobales bacterium]|nr:valine--tRNA ligase [Terriglobales bacterium]
EVATTRPETILADVAVAVNPADPRYTALIGKQVAVPLAGRTVPVIADEIAQPEFGTGAVKITPGHDPNDFAAGQRHNLPQLVVLDEAGKMSGPHAGAYAGLDRFAARKRMVADLEAAGLLAAVSDHPMAVGHCQRCRTVIEPRISTQWFVKIAPLAQAAAQVVEEGKIRFTPENNKAIYLGWMANIHDWCISRQLWWGHRIPAWYCDACPKTVVAESAPSACPGCGGALRQDADVLDTWFSSGLWPFSTLGWPAKTEDLRDFYPTSLLITGFDILFFWVARMIMLGVHFTQEVPFREVYIHALVRDAERQKMSKTKGNVIDPLLVTEKFGTDAVRFTLAAMAAPGTDIALSEDRMAGYAAFANKIWNAARFIFMSANQAGAAAPTESPAQLRPRGRHMVDRWIFSRLNAVAAQMRRSLDEYRFHEAADTLYHFFWHEFCDWYIELTKLRLQAGDADAAPNLLLAFDGALRLLHPVMPFITEELWTALHADAPPAVSIALTPFPQPDEKALDPEAEAALTAMQAAVTESRQFPARLDGHLADAGLAWAHAYLPRLAKIGQKPAADPAQENARRDKRRAELSAQIQKKRQLLANDRFRSQAAAAIVATEEAKLADLESELASLTGN